MNGISDEDNGNDCNNQNSRAPNKRTVNKSQLRTYNSLVSLVPSTTHYWHCSHHNNSSSSSTTSTQNIKTAVKRNTNSTLPKSRSSHQCSPITSNKPFKTLPRKNTKPVFLSSSLSSSSSSSKSESDDQQSPQTRSILRHTSKYKSNSVKRPSDIKSSLEQWTLGGRKKTEYELSSHSDSESSDITISSRDSADYIYHKDQSNKTSWQSKRRNSHKVCFVDEIIEHKQKSTKENNCKYPIVLLLLLLLSLSNAVGFYPHWGWMHTNPSLGILCYGQTSEHN